jgi:hypothetical protein
MDPIQAAIAKAQAAAGNVATAAGAVAEAANPTATAGTAVATTNATGGVVAAPGQKFSMDQLMTGAMNVDIWAKVKEYGLLVGGEELLQEFEGYIDMTEGIGFAVKMSIKAGNPAQYWSTYDGVTSDKGIPWNEAVAKAGAIDNKQKPYRSVDVPIVLTKDLVSPKGVTLAKEGTRVGYATSTTNWREWQDFYQRVVQEGLLGARVLVKVTSKRMTNKAGNAWGVMCFESLGEYVEVEADA